MATSSFEALAFPLLLSNGALLTVTISSSSSSDEVHSIVGVAVPDPAELFCLLGFLFEAEAFFGFPAFADVEADILVLVLVVVDALPFLLIAVLFAASLPVPIDAAAAVLRLKLGSLAVAPGAASMPRISLLALSEYGELALDEPGVAVPEPGLFATVAPPAMPLSPVDEGRSAASLAPVPLLPCVALLLLLLAAATILTVVLACF